MFKLKAAFNRINTTYNIPVVGFRDRLVGFSVTVVVDGGPYVTGARVKTVCLVRDSLVTCLSVTSGVRVGSVSTTGFVLLGEAVALTAAMVVGVSEVVLEMFSFSISYA